MEFLNVIGICLIAYSAGLLVSKIKMPAILGWLITGIVFGPFLVGLVTFEIIDGDFYQVLLAVAECFAGVFFVSGIKQKDKTTGIKVVDAKHNKFGVLIITLFESMSTFIIVSIVFSIVFLIQDIPIYLAFIFAGIATATAPAPSISIVQQYKTNGPLTRTLIPVALIDDGVATLLFMTTIMIITAIFGMGGGESISPDAYQIIGMIIPYVACVVLAVGNVFICKKINNNIITSVVTGFLFVMSIVTGLLCDLLIGGEISTMYLFIGIVYMIIIGRSIPRGKLIIFIRSINPLLTIGIILVILDLGMPLDYRMIASAGLYTAIYIIARAVGKIGGASIGAKVAKSDINVVKYLGFTLLPHSGVSLIFTAMAIEAIAPFAPELVAILQGTIAAAAVINEIIAVILCNQAFKWAGEMPDSGTLKKELFGFAKKKQIKTDTMTQELSDNVDDIVTERLLHEQLSKVDDV